MAPRTAPTAPTPTLPELRAELQHLHAERQALGKMLDDIPAREHALLDENAPDDAFAKVELDRRRAHHRLQKLNARHIEIDAAILVAEAVEKGERWSEWVDQYEQLARQMAEAADALTVAHAALFAVCNEAQRDGFSAYSPDSIALPYPPPIHVQALAHGVLGTVPALRLQRFGKQDRRLWAVRFRDWTAHGDTAYLAQQEAGFDAATAWELVLAQKADWPDETNIPPRPPARQRKPRSRPLSPTMGQGQ